MLKDLVLKNRSYRRFFEETHIEKETLTGLVDLARLTASSANLQPLKYILSNEPEKNTLIFDTLKWAGYLKDWPGPSEGERPSAYIIILGDTGISKNFASDQGIAAQTILLGAVEKGLGGCIIASIDKLSLRSALKIPEQFELLLVIALGKPKETVVIEPVGPLGDIKYWRDGDETHHVPKRSLEDLILKNS